VGQNINKNMGSGWGIKLSLDTHDITLSSDNQDFNREVVFSPYLIAQTYGNRLPINIDINDPLSCQGQQLIYKMYNTNNIMVSQNYYLPDDIKPECIVTKESCDIGLTGIDNGLVNTMTGESITYTNGLLPDDEKFDRLSFDRRMKMFQVTGYTSSNVRFSGFNKNVLYEVISKEDEVGKYHELYGGFYQGFYKLFGYDYDILPNRMNKGWSVEMVLKPRLVDEYFPNDDETTLNEIYPNNKNTFFYFGTRAENKFYHHADGEPFSGYTRVTSELVDMETCACCNTGVTNSRCIFIYPPKSKDDIHDPHQNYGCDLCSGKPKNTCSGCGCPTEHYDTCGWECKTHSCGNTIENTCESDTLMDSLSNALSFRLCGEVNNPRIGVRVLHLTEYCTSGDTCSTGMTYSTGYTINEYCTPPIYSYCSNINEDFLNKEHWFLVNVVWERYRWMDDVDLCLKGGLNNITEFKLLESLANNTISLITVPYTQSGATPAEEVELVRLNDKWLTNKEYRKGRLKIYANGRLIHTIENFEEIIPRGLSTDKERQVGVPFNISWGGGTQGLREHLTFSSSTLTDGLYIQDPECLTTIDLSGTTFSGLNNNMLIEENFAGTFEGAVSQFRMYITPMSAPEVKHNFKLLKDKFDMFNPDCPDCETELCRPNDFTYEIINNTTEINPTLLGRNYIADKRDKDYLIKNNFSKIVQIVKNNKIKPTPTPTRKDNIVKILPTPTPTPTPSTTPKRKSMYWESNEWWGNQGNTSQCVGYAWAHWIEDGPIRHGGIPPIVDPTYIYVNAQKIDEWPGENYDGTSIRAGAKFLKSINKISSYYWAFDLKTLIDTVLYLGPVVCGTNWYHGMFYPNASGVIRPTGRVLGGHAYVINGIDIDKKLFRIKNSWGQRWGKNGFAYISFTDMEKLIRENGEICIAAENEF